MFHIRIRFSDWVTFLPLLRTRTARSFSVVRPTQVPTITQPAQTAACARVLWHLGRPALLPAEARAACCAWLRWWCLSACSCARAGSARCSTHPEFFPGLVFAALTSGVQIRAQDPQIKPMHVQLFETRFGCAGGLSLLSRFARGAAGACCSCSCLVCCVVLVRCMYDWSCMSSSFHCM